MVSLLQDYGDDSDPEGISGKETQPTRLMPQPSPLSDDDSDDEDGPVLKPGRLNFDEYSSTELFARIQVKPRGTFNKELTTQKSFHNPHFLNSVVKKFKIDQFGTNYSKEAYCPKECRAADLCYTFLQEKVIEFERKRIKEQEKKPETAPESAAATPAPPSDRRRASKWSEAVKNPADTQMPLLPGLGLPLPVQASVPPTAPGQLPAAYNNPLQQAVAIAARLKTIASIQKPPTIPLIIPAPSVVTPAAVAAAAAAARERAAKASVPAAPTPASEEEITRKRQAALALLRESSEKKRKQLSAIMGSAGKAPTTTTTTPEDNPTA